MFFLVERANTVKGDADGHGRVKVILSPLLQICLATVFYSQPACHEERRMPNSFSFTFIFRFFAPAQRCGFSPGHLQATRRTSTACWVGWADFVRAWVKLRTLGDFASAVGGVNESRYSTTAFLTENTAGAEIRTLPPMRAGVAGVKHVGCGLPTVIFNGFPKSAPSVTWLFIAGETILENNTFPANQMISRVRFVTTTAICCYAELNKAPLPSGVPEEESSGIIACQKNCTSLFWSAYTGTNSTVNRWLSLVITSNT